MQCSTCQRMDVGEIEFSTVAAGVRFFYCRYCEHTWWEAREGSLELDAVLDAARDFARA